MSNSRKPDDARDESAIRAANELDVELSKLADEIDQLDEVIRAATPKSEPKVVPGHSIDMKEYESLNASPGLGGFFRSFTGPKVSAGDQNAINAYKAELHGAGSDEVRYAVAVDQRDKIYGTKGVSGALKQYADRLDDLIQNANTRALAAEYQAKQKK